MLKKCTRAKNYPFMRLENINHIKIIAADRNETIFFHGQNILFQKFDGYYLDLKFAPGFFFRFYIHCASSWLSLRELKDLQVHLMAKSNSCTCWDNDWQFIYSHIFCSLHSKSELDRTIKSELVKAILNMAGFFLPKDLLLSLAKR